MSKFATGVFCLVAAALITSLDRGHAWSWPLFAWGCAIGATGCLGSFAIGRMARIDSNRWDAYPSFILTALAVAILAAGLRNVWVAGGFAAYVAIANFALPVTVLPRMRRAATHACGSSGSSCSAEACATCPLVSAGRVGTASAARPASPSGS